MSNNRQIRPPVPLSGVVVKHRTAISVVLHAALFVVSLLSSFALAYNFAQFAVWFFPLFFPLLVIVLPIKLLVFWWTGQYFGSWRYVGLRDLFSMAKASYLSSFLFVIVYFSVENIWSATHGGMPLFDPVSSFKQSVFLLDVAATIAFVAGARIGYRFYHEELRTDRGDRAIRALIVGAGDSGEALLREILRAAGSPYQVVGFLDDNATPRSARIHEVPVLGTVSHIRDICQKHDVEEVWIALDRATPSEMRKVVEQCQGANLRFRTVPPAMDLIEGRVQVSQIRDVEITDLLGRQQVELDTEAIGRQLSGQRIAVTGAGGSIGAEMCRQIARFEPEQLILIEQAENNLFEIDRELRKTFPDLSIRPCVADICDRARMVSLLRSERPSAVFHAAAHKHVPMMECNAGEAVKNNVLGTKTVADAAIEAGVDKMVMISTDKAVNPTSIMGCSKRVAELYVQQLDNRSSTHFVTVRFGNVLGSSGSVIPIFRQQIANGGPVTVTHPEMTRYFMTIPEAAQLVLQAGTMGNGGEIYVLDMGEPIKIVDLAEAMITLSGLRPGEDIEIQFTGIRPGEKLYEELSIEGEDVSRTKHSKIGIWRNRPEDWDRLSRDIMRLIESADVESDDGIRDQLRRLVPEFVPNPEAKATARTSVAQAAAVMEAPTGAAKIDPALGM